MNSGLSVIIPVKNHQQTLRSAVLSVLKQLPKNGEILVIDDSSTDASIPSIRDLKLRIYPNTHKPGPAGARNCGIEHARFNVVGFLDSDNLMEPSSVQWRMDYLNQHPTANAISGTIKQVLFENQLIPFSSITRCETPTRAQWLSASFFSNGGTLPSPMESTLFKTSHLVALGGYDETLPQAEDKDFYFRCVQHSPIFYVPRPTHIYRIWERNTSGFWNGEYFQLYPHSLAHGWLVDEAFKRKNTL